MNDVVIASDDPRAADVRALLGRHLAFNHEHTPPDDVHALDLDGLLDPAVSFFSARRDGELVAIGALKELNPTHGEVKSMHTMAAARGQGLARAMVDHLIELARRRGYRRVSLETGSMDAYAPARSLYLSAGFASCGPFGEYASSPNSSYFTLELTDEPAVATWPDGPGVVALPDGRRVRGRGLRHPLPPGAIPDLGVYLVGRDPGRFDWDSRWVRWRDFGTPASTPDALAALRVAHDRASNERVEIACGGGRGRTGTALAALAILAGVPGPDAVAWVRRSYHRRAVETPWQRRWVREVALAG